MKASLVYRNKRILLDGSIQEIVIWKLPEATKDQPHGMKYRLYFGLQNGICLVRYDNEKGKGDHKHLLDKEEPYDFTDVETLIADFFSDVKRAQDGTL